MAPEKVFRKYISEGYTSLYLGPILVLLGGVMFLAESVIGYLGGLFLIAMGVYMVYCWFRDKKQMDRQMEAWRSTGVLQGLLAEFQQSAPVFKDTLRLGQTHLFPKGTGKVLTYGQLTQVYQYVHKRNFVEDRRELRAVVAGKEITLANLPLKGKGDEDLKKVLGFFLMKNPGIHVGYNK